MSPITILALLIWVVVLSRAAWLMTRPYGRSVTS